MCFDTWWGRQGHSRQGPHLPQLSAQGAEPTPLTCGLVTDWGVWGADFPPSAATTSLGFPGGVGGVNTDFKCLCWETYLSEQVVIDIITLGNATSFHSHREQWSFGQV